jgi:hypothetical protein
MKAVYACASHCTTDLVSDVEAQLRKLFKLQSEVLPLRTLLDLCNGQVTALRDVGDHLGIPSTLAPIFALKKMRQSTPEFAAVVNAVVKRLNLSSASERVLQSMFFCAAGHPKGLISLCPPNIRDQFAIIYLVNRSVCTGTSQYLMLNMIYKVFGTRLLELNVGPRFIENLSSLTLRQLPSSKHLHTVLNTLFNKDLTSLRYVPDETGHRAAATKTVEVFLNRMKSLMVLVLHDCF